MCAATPQPRARLAPPPATGSDADALFPPSLISSARCSPPSSALALGPPRQTLRALAPRTRHRRFSPRALTAHSSLPRLPAHWPTPAHTLLPVRSTRSLLAPSLLHSAASLLAAAPTPPRSPSRRSAPSRTATSRPARPSSTSSPGRPSPRPTSRRPSNPSLDIIPGLTSHTRLDVSTYDLSLRVEAARLQARLDLLSGAARLAVRDHAPDGEADLPSAECHK